MKKTYLTPKSEVHVIRVHAYLYSTSPAVFNDDAGEDTGVTDFDGAGLGKNIWNDESSDNLW